jgi:hypothetical protein
VARMGKTCNADRSSVGKHFWKCPCGNLRVKREDKFKVYVR